MTSPGALGIANINTGGIMRISLVVKSPLEVVTHQIPKL